MFTVFGFIIGVSLVAFGILTGKAPADMFLNWQGLAIVVGGTVASTFVSHPIREVLRAVRSCFIVFSSGSHDYIGAIKEMVHYIRTYSRDGLEKLETEVNARNKLWILKDGVQLMVNGYSKEEAHEILEDQIRWQMSREMKQHQLFGSMAKIAPAFGMIGTLIGLINMLITLQSQPGEVGLGLAIALTTTFYGLALANMLFGPISEKLRERAENNLFVETMQLEAVLMMYEKRNYVYARDKLAAYVSASNRKKVSDYRQMRNKSGKDTKRVVIAEG
jgi:chemotaxis protein MotA